ncbi:SpoIIE family protein phosphatase [Streptacidiphilus jiangxiensis]|uniref:GAF domain-containing protein n=1 Tax=Streptacidiphilus jiangxiensis TaxID=235985 RepID=A0A1H7Y8U1_STRJI|nr:SpoIIE family protein phosphatase [Streptacidiphilus jiangxiensis]SEM42636.1 GAF domain-containing protein [Streptacidiphilus jiangxiensis]
MSAARPEQAPGEGPPPEPGSLTERAFEQSPVPWMLCAPDGRLLRLNQAMAELAELTEAQLVGRLPTELQQGHNGAINLVDSSVFEESTRLIQEVAATGTPRTLETYVQAPAGLEAQAWEVRYSPVHGAGGALEAVAVTAVDFTEQFVARQRLGLLNAAAAGIGASLDVTRTAQDLVDVTVPGFADFVSVDLLDGVFQGEEPAAGPLPGPVLLRRAAQARTGASSGTTPLADPSGERNSVGVVEAGERGSYPLDSPPARCLATGRSARYAAGDPVLDSWFAADTARGEWARGHGLVSLLTVPVTARETTLGVVILVRLGAAVPFSPDEQSIAEELVAHAAICLDNARRFTRERTTALTLQHSLLQQRPPRQAAVEVAARYLPASGQAGVGGDWYDVIPLSGTRVALVVGDVTGHGLHASVTMARLRTAVRTLADVDLPPDELLSHLDDLVISLNAEAGAYGPEDAAYGGLPGSANPFAPPGTPTPTGEGLGGGQVPGASALGASALGSSTLDGLVFGDIGATCLYAVYDPIARRVALARAGHPVPAVRLPDGRVEFLDVPAGPPLGLGGLAFETAEVDLPEGSLLALYTDGLIESRHRDVDESLRLLAATLAEPGQDVPATGERVLRVLTRHRPEDDVALLLARTRALGADQVADWEIDPDPACVADARRLAARQLAHWGLDDLVFVTELVVSELVTNAIRHGRPPIRLRLIRDSALTCEVSDSSSTAPHLRRARTMEEGGRGLMLVAQCATRWGTRHSADGKTIWAEQALPGA